MLLPAKPVPGKPIPASWGSTLVDYLRSITPRSSASVRVRTGAGGTTFEASSSESGQSAGAGFPWSKLALGYSLAFDPDTSETTCTIYPGTVRIHGKGEIEAGGDIVLTGTPCMVYIQYARPLGPATLQVSNPDPETELYPRSNGSSVKIPLYIFGGTQVTPEDGDPYLTYTLTRICNMGDVNFDTPIR